MGCFRKSVATLEEELALISNFPDVVGVDADGQFVTHTSSDVIDFDALTTWAHGIYERRHADPKGVLLQKTLAIERQSGRTAVECERQGRQNEIAKLQQLVGDDCASLSPVVQGRACGADKAKAGIGAEPRRPHIVTEGRLFCTRCTGHHLL